MNQKITAFRTITEDYELDSADAQKFIKWGKGDIQQALNYYYNHLEKGKIKYKSQPIKNVAETFDHQDNFAKVQQSQNESSNSNAFQIMRRGSVKQQKTQSFINKVRKLYKLPINGKSQSQLIKNSSSSLTNNIPDQFLGSDYLPDAFDLNKLEPIEIIEKKRGMHTRSFEPLQQKMQQNEIIAEQKTYLKKFNKQSNYRTLKEPQYQQERADSQISQYLPEQQMMIQGKMQKQQQLEDEEQQYHQEKDKYSNYNFSEELKEKQLYVGDYFMEAFCTEKRKLDFLNHNDEVQIAQYIEDLKTKKKKGFASKGERVMHMRIYYNGKQIGRIQDNEVRIIMPLIHEKNIRVQFYLADFPLFSDLFKPMKLKAKIYFTRKMITQPIVQSFEPQQKDKDKVHQVSALLTKLNLPILVQPLVKGKSKYVKASKPQKKEKQSIDLFNYRKYEEQQNKRRLDAEKRNAIQQIKIRNDPNYSLKQKSLSEMINRKSSSNDASQKQIHDTTQEDTGKIQSKDGVEKKVIQIDTKIQKDKFSQLIDLYEENIEPYQPPSDFASELYGYQALALAWMLKRQGYPEQKEEAEEIHPLWSQYEIPTSPHYRLFFNELTGQVCVKRPISKIQCKGGILADQMGLGKTVMMAALIVSHKPKAKPKQLMGGTLVIVPLTLLSQWESQLSRHTKNLKVLIYYSTTRKSLQKSLHKFDVVISTYGTASHEFAQGCHIKKTGIFRLKWHRIILDQAHYIKGRIIQTSKAMYELVGRHRWCLTGTPIQNVVGDLFSLLHFIKYTPWSEHACWSRFIQKPLQQGEKSIFEVLKTILRRVFLRRTKNSEGSDGKPIVQLPARISKIQLLTMSAKERQFYDSVYKSSRIQIDALIEKGILEAKYMQVLQMLIRLRQICCHPILFKSVAKFTKNTEQFEVEIKKMVERWKLKAEKENSQSQDEYYEPLINADNQQERVKTTMETINFSTEYYKEVINKVNSGNLDICIVCLNDPEDPLITPCLHIFCKPCLIRQIQQQGFCPSCRLKISRDDYLHLPREDRLNLKQKNDIFLSTKIKALLEHLSEMKIGDKAVIFSQFLGFLDLLEKEIKKCGMKYVRMQGSNTHKERTKIVKQFQEDPKVQIFLVSLKTAGVGLNLIAANKVFLMDPWWNPAVEEQAIERVHRIGQKKNVVITRFIMDKTIEARMLELNTQKKVLSQNVLSNSHEDNPLQKMEKLKYLMQTY